MLELTKKVNEGLDARSSTVPIRVAVMGCVVNGPGEAREADVGIASGKGSASSFVAARRWQRCPRTSSSTR